MAADATADNTLLAVCTLPPWPITNGYALRVANVLHGLSSRWRITLLAPPVPPGTLPDGIADHRPLDLAGAGLTYPWRFDQTRLRAALHEAIQANPFERALVWPGAEAAWFARAGLPSGVMDMIDCNPLEFFRQATARGTSARERLRSLRELVPAATYARRTVRSFTATVCVGDQDAAWMRRIGGRDTVHVIPNGVAAPDAGALAAEGPRPTLSFTGTLDYPPNIDAALYLATAVWPLVRRAVPDAALVLAGRRPVAPITALHGRDGIEVAADVPDMAAVLGRSWVSVAPMRTGVGIKNKVLEAWACARPVVLTPLATNGLVLPDGHAALVQSGAGAFALKAVYLLQSSDARHRLGAAARAHVLTRFSWRAAADGIDRLLRL